MKLLKPLLSKKFTIYDSGEVFSKNEDFLEVLKLLANFSDFFRYEREEQETILKEWIKDGNIYINADKMATFDVD
jgi:hypothetical protein